MTSERPEMQRRAMRRLALCYLLVILSHVKAETLERYKYAFSGFYGTPNISAELSISATVSDKAECGKACVQLQLCQSFSFQSGALGCRLYKRRIMAQDAVQPSSEAHFSRAWASCPTRMGFIRLPGTNKCILLGNLFLTWTRAAEACGKHGGHLLTIENGDVMQKLLDILPEDSYWAGCSDLATEGQYLWQDGTTVDNSLFHASQPDDQGNRSHAEDCGSFSIDPVLPGLHDDNCETTRRFICSLTLQM